MKNSTKLYLLAALTVALSLAADMNPNPPSNSDLHPMDDPKPSSENFYGIVLATDVSVLRKRQTEYSAGCPTGSFYVEDVMVPGCYSCPPAHYLCPNSQGCCPNGIECIPGTLKCRKPCDPGSTLCYDLCCPAGYSCIAEDEPCLRTKSATTLVSNAFEVSTLVTSFKPFIMIPTTSMAAISSTTSVSSSTTIPTTPKAATSSTTLISPFTTSPISSTSTTANSEPTSSPTTEVENSSRSTESVNTSPSSSTTAPESGSNDSNQGNWLGGFVILFFFVFFCRCSSKN